MKLLEVDKKIIESGDWLNDRIINAGQRLLRRQFPEWEGFQDTLLGQNLTFAVCKKMFVQILNVGNQHWIAVSSKSECTNIHATICQQSVNTCIFVGLNNVTVYDSLPSSTVSSRTKDQIAAICFCEDSSIKLTYPKIQIQSGGNDCGFFALAFSFAICSGQNPSRLNFTQCRFRKHLLSCLERGIMESFPTSHRERREGQAVHSTIPVFCHCRLPDDGGLMVSCSNCEEWFHKECETVPEIVWLKKNKKHIWFCKNC